MPSYSLQIITDKTVWENYLSSRPEANFLQSWNWGVFQQKLGKQVWYCGFFAGEENCNQTQVAAALCIKEKAKRGTYLTIAGGPLTDWHNEALLQFIFSQIRSLAQTEKCLFVRLRPQEIDTPELRATVKKLGLAEAPMHLTADLTLQLDLTKPLETLLIEMRKNTRYEVKSAAKENIVVKTSTNPDDIRPFYEQQLAVARKHHFVPFSFRFLDEQFRTFVADSQVILFHAYKQTGELLASAFIIFYHGEAVYHYGVSTPANERQPGSYACQWAAIQWAKEHGGLKYNFWGIAPQDKPDHRFAGVSLFKRGFGGTEVQYLPAHDLAVGWSYQMVRQFELLRKKLRKL